MGQTSLLQTLLSSMLPFSLLKLNLGIRPAPDKHGRLIADFKCVCGRVGKVSLYLATRRKKASSIRLACTKVCLLKIVTYNTYLIRWHISFTKDKFKNYSKCLFFIYDKKFKKC